MREYSTGDYGITFLGGGSHGWYFEFSKENKLKFKLPHEARTKILSEYLEPDTKRAKL